jgi:nicotinate phosphoribosyltransferase
MLSSGLGLFTDLYELTMAQTYFEQRMFAPATFGLFVRSYPPNRGYFVCAGLEDALEYLENLHFDGDSLDYLSATGMFTEDFLEYMGGLRFTGSVRAMPEGRLYFTNEPVMEVTAPIIEAQLVETLIINRLNLQSLQATKAARCVWAAQGRTLSDFGARRAPGVDGAMSMARAGYIVGFQSTSNVLAAQRYGIPPAGTMAHSLITTFPTEIEAFRAYAQAFPDRTILLLDTYDTIQGAWHAAEVGREMEAAGHKLVAVRLDSGDYAELSRQVRRILDQAGLEYVRIVASGGLDEYEIDKLIQGGAPIDLFGVGTKVGSSADAPYSDMSYKLVCYDGQPVMKLSPEKVSPPGAKQVYRLQETDRRFAQDIVALQEETLPGGEPLLETVMESGQRTRPAPSLTEIRERFSRDFQQLDDHYKRIYNPPRYPVTFSARLQRQTNRVQAQLLDNIGETSS